MAIDATVCPQCVDEEKRPTAPPPRPPYIPTRGKLIREIGIFLIGLGVLAGGGGAAILGWLTGERALVLGCGLVMAGGAQVLCGLLLLSTRMNLFAYAGATVAVLLFSAWLVMVGLADATSARSTNSGAGLLIPGAAALFIVYRVSMLAKARDK
jgi:hypothetical protein